MRRVLFIIWLLTIVLIVGSSLASLAFLCYYRNTPIVAMGQPRMLAIICFGMLMVASTMIFDYMVHSSSWSVWCDLRIWFHFIGYTTIVTTMFCMLYRVHKVMRIRRGQTILPKHVMGPLVAAQIVMIGFLVWYRIKFPPKITIADGILFCDYPGSIDWIMFAVIQGFFVLLYISTILFAWKIRHVNEEIGSSRKIFLVCWFIVIVDAVSLAIFLWLSFSKSLEFTTIYYIYSVAFMLLNLLSNMAIIGFLILPRMYYVWYERTHGHLPESVTMIGTGKVHVKAPTAKAKATPPISSGNQQDEAEIMVAEV